jgi:hypothetical protein
MICLRFPSVFDDLLCFRLIQWNPAPAPVMNPALPGDSSESNSYTPMPYGERDALRFKAERDESRRELGENLQESLHRRNRVGGPAQTVVGNHRRYIPQINPQSNLPFDTNHHCLATLQPATPSLTS